MAESNQLSEREQEVATLLLQGKGNKQIAVALNITVRTVDTSAVLGGDRLHVFATNRSLDQAASVRVHLADGAIVALDSAELLTGPDAKVANLFEQPDVIVSRSFADAGVDVKIAESEASLELPPLSVAAMTFNLG